MPDTTNPTANTKTRVIGGHGLRQADVDRLFADQPAVRDALTAQITEAARPRLTAEAQRMTAEAARTVAAPAAPCGCADCAEAHAAVTAAEGEGLPPAA